MTVENCLEQNFFVFIKAIIDAINYFIYKINKYYFTKIKEGNKITEIFLISF